MSEDIKVTDGTILEALNGKVDLDGGNYKGSALEEYIHEHCSADKANLTLDNVSNIGTSLASSWAMPSARLQILTVGAVGTIYTAPANGYFHVIVRLADSSGHLSLRDEDNGLAVIQTIPKINTMAQVSIPARKGARIKLEYLNPSTGSLAYSYLAFIYAVGSESEAS